MLDLVGLVLKEANVPHVFCRGNVHMMSKNEIVNTINESSYT
jgi:hypothetical protein